MTKWLACTVLGLLAVISDFFHRHSLSNQFDFLSTETHAIHSLNFSHVLDLTLHICVPVCFLWQRALCKQTNGIGRIESCPRANTRVIAAR